MDKELKEKWVAALRSGVYEQAQETLVDETQTGNASYCCLGVLCCVSGRFRSTVEFRDFGTLRYLYKANGLLGRAAAGELADMNDNGASFEQIADYIEAKL